MKQTFVLLALLLGLTACQPEPAATPPAEKPAVDLSKQNTEFIQQYFKYFNAHEWDKMADMYVENADFKDPSLGPGIVKQSKAETTGKYGQLNEIFSDLHDEVINVYPSGNKHVIVEFISSGTAPDSSKFELPICTIFTIEDGKITKDYTYYDNFEEGEE